MDQREAQNLFQKIQPVLKSPLVSLDALASTENLGCVKNKFGLEVSGDALDNNPPYLRF